jgi:hypothetical protein
MIKTIVYCDYCFTEIIWPTTPCKIRLENPNESLQHNGYEICVDCFKKEWNVFDSDKYNEFYSKNISYRFKEEIERIKKRGGIMAEQFIKQEEWNKENKEGVDGIGPITLGGGGGGE